MENAVFAHSLRDQPIELWEPLSSHLAAVGDRAAEFAESFGWAHAARVAGRLHDIGKCSAAFQDYIRRGRGDGEPTRGPDHSTAGARVAATTYPGTLGRMLAYAIAGHHAGLCDSGNLEERLVGARLIEPYDGWEAHCGPLPQATALVSPLPARNPEAGFSLAFLARMLFSCLVDADFLETERFYAEAEGEPLCRGGFLDLAVLRDRLRGHMADRQASAEPSAMNSLRAEVLDHVVARADQPPGLFTLTVPTGGGKTLASLSFALEHALRHGLSRVVYVVPFTSIIEQTAQVFREALTTQDDILEHHASFDWERAEESRRDDGEGPDGLAKLRRAAENWDAPIVVTTAVQFFESLFAARTTRCRKLHNLAGAVIVLDEAQTLPIHLLRPCVAALDELQRNYRASIVLCTATQPALRKVDGFKRGFDLDDSRELAPNPTQLYERLRRVRVEQLADPIGDEIIAARFGEQLQMLCIVNSRAHARAVFEAIRNLAGAVHLTTLMCPRHRRAVLDDVRLRLKDGEPVRLVSTSLIEAGVDVDFPEVWRAAAGLDSIAQAAGRCNREGRAALGRTVVFVPALAKPPRELEAFWQAARPVFRKFSGDDQDLLGLEAVREYFRELYWQKGDAALDAAKVGERRGILPAIAERAAEGSFPFAGIAQAFKMIDEIMEPVIVPFDDEATRVLNRIASMDRPLKPDLRRLQQYTVSIPPRERGAWLASGVLRPVHARLGDVLLRFEGLDQYDPLTGVRLDDQWRRSAEDNVW